MFWASSTTTRRHWMLRSSFSSSRARAKDVTTTSCAWHALWKACSSLIRWLPWCTSVRRPGAKRSISLRQLVSTEVGAINRVGPGSPGSIRSSSKRAMTWTVLPSPI